MFCSSVPLIAPFIGWQAWALTRPQCGLWYTGTRQHRSKGSTRRPAGAGQDSVGGWTRGWCMHSVQQCLLPPLPRLIQRAGYSTRLLGLPLLPASRCRAGRDGEPSISIVYASNQVGCRQLQIDCCLGRGFRQGFGCFRAPSLSRFWCVAACDAEQQPPACPTAWEQPPLHGNNPHCTGTTPNACYPLPTPSPLHGGSRS